MLSRVEALENDVSMLLLLQSAVDIFQYAGRLGFNYANVVHASRTDADHSAVHERLDELRRVADRLDTVVVSGDEGWWRV